MRYPAPASPGPLPEAPVVVPDVSPSGTWALLLRLLIALGLVVGTVQLLSTPLHRPLDDLLRALSAGEVTTVTIEPAPALEQYSGYLTVHWDGGLRPAYSTYEYVSPDSAAFDDADVAPEDDVIDEREAILLAVADSPVEVTVVERPDDPPATGIHWQPGGTAAIAALLLLIGGPQPRIATKWAWFWLFVHVPPTVLVFALLEPTPLWRRGTVAGHPTRLTGGWGFLLGLVLAWLLSLIPGYLELFPA